MAKKSTVTSTSPKHSPKTESKRTPKNVPEVEPNNAPKLRPAKLPKPATIKAPITTPETLTISIYSLPSWDSDHSTNPHRYGNDGKAIGEFHTEGDAKEWLRNNECFGHFAAVERINGKIGKSWHIEIEPLDVEPENDLGLLDDDELDDAQLLNPDVVRAKIENAKLKAELKALSQNGGQSSIASLLQGIRMLDEMRGQANPQKSLVDQLREIKEINDLIAPRREQPHANAPQPTLSEEEALLKTLLRADKGKLIIDKISSGLLKKAIGDTAESEANPWIELARDVISSGQAAEIVKVAMGGLGSLFTPLFHKPPIQQPAQPQIIASAAMAQPPMPEPTTPPALNQPEPTAQQFGGQSPEEIAVMVAIRRLVARILPAMQMNADPIPTVNLLVSHCDVFPEHAPLIQLWMQGPAESLLMMLNQNVPEAQAITAMPHALEWTQKLQAAYFADEEESEENGAQDGTTKQQ